MGGLKVAPQSGPIAPGQCTILLLLLEIYHAITPMWLEKPERIAALAMVMVFGLLVYGLIQRQVRLYLRTH